MTLHIGICISVLKLTNHKLQLQGIYFKNVGNIEKKNWNALFIFFFYILSVYALSQRIYLCHVHNHSRSGHSQNEYCCGAIMTTALALR